MVRAMNNSENQIAAFNNKIRTICEKYLIQFPDELERLSKLMSLAEQPDIDLRQRSTIPEGHICASGIIISPDKSKILMLEHKALGILVVPGGHYDLEDKTPENTALREASEETGLEGLTLHSWHQINGIPLDIDIHPIPARPSKNEGAHVHYEFRFVLTVPNSEEIKLDLKESIGYEWVSIADVDKAWTIAAAIKKLPILSSGSNHI